MTQPWDCFGRLDTTMAWSSTSRADRRRTFCEGPRAIGLASTLTCGPMPKRSLRSQPGRAGPRSSKSMKSLPSVCAKRWSPSYGIRSVSFSFRCSRTMRTAMDTKSRLGRWFTNKDALRAIATGGNSSAMSLGNSKCSSPTVPTRSLGPN